MALSNKAQKRLEVVLAGAQDKDAISKEIIAALKQAASAGQAAHQADSTASDVAGLVADFNALLAKLQTAGLMA